MSAKVFSDETFDGLNDTPGLFQRQRRQIFENLKFSNCDFQNCHLGRYLPTEQRTIVRNVEVVNCTWHRCSVGTAILQDVLVDTLHCKERHSIGLGAPLLQHVIIRGKVNKLTIEAAPLVDAGPAANKVRSAYDEIRSHFYSSIDWALDISHGEFLHVRILGIPSRLIRRDPRTQGVISRDRINREQWEELWPSLDIVKQTDLITAVDRFVKSDDLDYVLIAGKMATDFELQVSALDELRNVGIVQPD